MNSALDESELLLSLGRQEMALGNRHISNLTTRIGTLNYIRMADEIARWKNQEPFTILDWGAGHGQMSYLLRNRGFKVTSFDVQKRQYKVKGSVVASAPVVVSSRPTKLPFKSGQFNGVLSCGVLEHVKDDKASLLEIRRILKPGGFLFITMLPNETSLVEWNNRRKGTSDHPIRYTPAKMKRMFRETGFEFLKCKYGNFFPKNLTGLPMSAKKVYDIFSAPLSLLEQLLIHVPLLNLLSGTLEIV